MSRILHIIIFLIQAGITGLTAVGFYMLIALLDFRGGIDGIVGLGFHMIWALLFAALTVSVCGFIGLPIRLVKRFSSWWSTHFYIALLLVVAGLSFLLYAFLPMNMTSTEFQDSPGIFITIQLPDLGFVALGWGLFAFGLMHTYPPLILLKKVEEVVAQVFKPKSHQH